MTVVLPENSIMARTDSIQTFFNDVKRLYDAGYKFRVTVADNLTINNVPFPGVLGIFVFDQLPTNTVLGSKLVEIRYDTENMKWVPAKPIDLEEIVLESQFAYFKNFLENYNNDITV